MLYVFLYLLYSGSQPGVILSLQGKSGNIQRHFWLARFWWGKGGYAADMQQVDTRDVDKHITIHRMFSLTKSYSAPNVNFFEIEKLSYRVMAIDKVISFQGNKSTPELLSPFQLSLHRYQFQHLPRSKMTGESLQQIPCNKQRAITER